MTARNGNGGRGGGNVDAARIVIANERAAGRMLAAGLEAVGNGEKAWADYGRQCFQFFLNASRPPRNGGNGAGGQNGNSGTGKGR